MNPWTSHNDATSFRDGYDERKKLARLIRAGITKIMLTFLQDEDPTKTRRSIFLAATISFILSRFDEHPDLARLFLDVESDTPLFSTAAALFWLWIAIAYLLVRYALHIRSAFLEYSSNFEGVLQDHSEIVLSYQENQKAIINQLKVLSTKCDEIDRHCEIMTDPHRMAQLGVSELKKYVSGPISRTIDASDLQQDLVALEKRYGSLKEADYVRLRDQKSARLSELYKHHAELATFSSPRILNEITEAASTSVRSVKTAAFDGLVVAPFALLVYVAFALYTALPTLIATIMGYFN